MPYPTQEELLAADDLAPWVDEHFLRPDPYAFETVGFRPTLSIICEKLEIDPNGVFVIGSGAIGISLNPGKIFDGNLKTFDEGSDLDLALISEVYFEQAWRDLRTIAHAGALDVPQLVEDNLSWQKKRFFEGTIVANKLLPALSFGPVWVAHLLEISQEISIVLDREIEVNMWIYRDYWSLRNYVLDGLLKCKGALV
jgi:hypothetical protein